MDWADEKAHQLFDGVRNAETDERVIASIAEALREAAMYERARIVASLQEGLHIKSVDPFSTAVIAEVIRQGIDIRFTRKER